jgi:hypothetical protein
MFLRHNQVRWWFPTVVVYSSQSGSVVVSRVVVYSSQSGSVVVPTEVVSTGVDVLN